MFAEHLVATTRGRDRSMLSGERACWLWERLRLGIPLALSCVLMPDHLHLVALLGRLPRFRRILSAFTARYGVRFDVLPPAPVASRAIAGRVMRYGYFNPVRAGFVEDPFEWTWSSLRDLVGAVEPVWTPLDRVASGLRVAPATALRRLTQLGDCRPPLPRASSVVAASMTAVQHAVASALRLPDPADLRRTTARRLTVQLCFEIGAPSPIRLASDLRVDVRTIQRDRTPPHPALTAALLSLADERLRARSTVSPSGAGSRGHAA